MRRLPVVLALLVAGSAAGAEELVEVPEVDGEWWQIAPNAPDVGKWSTGQENACDFAIVRSSDGRWHCISRIWYNGKWAPEVIEHAGQYYIAGYGRGIHVARLQWRKKTREQIAEWRSKWLAYLAEENRKRRDRERRRREAQ